MSEPDEPSNDTNETYDPPLECQVDIKLKAFRVTRIKGGTLAKGGYGFSKADPETNTTHEYLFVEEVIYLHERGMILVKDGDAVLGSYQLYNLLEVMGISFPVYLAYAYLRGQTFRVFRYTTERHSLIQEMNALIREKDGVSLKEVKKTQTFRQLQTQLRGAIASAPCPNISTSGNPFITFDVHKPDTNFSRSNPGLPDFYCAITYFHESDMDFTTVQRLLDQCKGIPLKIGAVSDGGSVLMLRATDSGVPDMKKKSAKEDNNGGATK